MKPSTLVRIAVVPLFSALLVVMSGGGAAGCGQNIPNVEGTYNLTSTGCPGTFADTVTITQSGDVVTFDPPGLSGSIDINGDFNVSNGDITCTGGFTDLVASATCKGDAIGSCDIVYQKQE
jgi:hypothetical protein